MQILCTRDLDAISECDAVLLSAGITPTWQRVEATFLAAVLEVDDADSENACAALTAVCAETGPPRTPQPPLPSSPLWQPAFATALGMACLLLVFFAITGP